MRFIKTDDMDMLLQSVALSDCIVIPTQLLNNPEFTCLPDGAQMLYGHLLYQMINDYWFPDYRSRCCLRFSVKSVEASLNCSYGTAISYLNVLKHHGFIGVENLGKGKDNLIYLVLLDDFIVKEE
jgi:hypothetical protein